MIYNLFLSIKILEFKYDIVVSPQVVGDVNAVKNAIAIISSRLRESQHRDRGHFHGRMHSPERFFPPDDDYMPHINSTARRSSDGANFGPRLSANNIRSNNYASRSSGFIESGVAPMVDHVQSYYGEDIVFRILCPIDKVDSVVGEADGILELLRNEIGVDVRVTDPVVGSDEQIIIISSEEVLATSLSFEAMWIINFKTSGVP